MFRFASLSLCFFLAVHMLTTTNAERLSREERRKKNVDRLIERFDSDGEIRNGLLNRASAFTEEQVNGLQGMNFPLPIYLKLIFMLFCAALLPEATDNWRERVLTWATKPDVAEILRNPPSESQGVSFEGLSRNVNERLNN